LRRRRHDLGVEDRPLLVDLVAVPQHASRRLGPGEPGARARRHLDGRTIRRLVAVEIRSASSNAGRISTLRTTMLWKGLLQTGGRPASVAASRATGESLSELSA
jgi:hypothetical protein